MKKTMATKKIALTVLVLGVFMFAAVFAACQPAQTNTEDSAAQIATPEPDSFGVITAASWAETYPDVYASYQANITNAPGGSKHSYLELYTALSTLYSGSPFSKGYDEAASHLFSLESVGATPRINEKSVAACITCKTPQFTALVNANGDAEYSKLFSETFPLMTEPISCYNCHDNDPTALTVGNQFFVKALGSDSSQVPEAAQVCGQCHNEYYFNPEDKVPTLPYSGLSEMNPTSMLAYYDEIGFSDWLYPGTDSPMLKAQHPEFETIYGGSTMSSMAKLGYACADCHMGTMTNDAGEEYVSHEWQSPLENKQLLESTCNTCHDDLAAEVKGWQDASELRVVAISFKIEELAKGMVTKVADGTLSGDKLATLQKLHRQTQWYWDFVMVENSEGAHNPDFSNQTLDTSEKLVDEALALLNS